MQDYYTDMQRYYIEACKAYSWAELRRWHWGRHRWCERPWGKGNQRCPSWWGNM